MSEAGTKWVGRAGVSGHFGRALLLILFLRPALHQQQAPPADVTVGRIGDLLEYDIADLCQGTPGGG